MKNNQHSNLAKQFNDNRLIIKWIEQQKTYSDNPKYLLNKMLKEYSRKQYKLKHRIKESQHQYTIKHKYIYI